MKCITITTRELRVKTPYNQKRNCILYCFLCWKYIQVQPYEDVSQVRGHSMNS